MATNKHPPYVTITVFPLQQWFHGRVSMFLYTYTACIVTFNDTKVTLFLKAYTSAMLEFI
jgi:hypothetical protein